MSAPRAALALALLTSGLTLATPAAAQVVERNLPPSPPETRPPALAPEPPISAAADRTPLGPALRAVVLLDPTEPAGGVGDGGGASGVTVSPALRLSAARAARALAPLLQRPLSRRLIAEAQAAVAKAYRSAGYPFLSVFPPEQELTTGVLRLRVVEFRVGARTVVGARSAEEARAIAARVRLSPGGGVNAPAVSDDIDWLERDPFRKVQPIFSPGAALGETDVRLQVTDARPFGLYAGYADSGSPSTGIDRYFAGGQVAGLLGFGSLASYQVTASDDALFNEGRLFSAADRPRYLSQAARLSFQPLPRTALEVAADDVETNTPAQDFVIDQRTYELAIDLRVALSKLDPALGGWGDMRLGLAGKRQETITLFGDAAVRQTALEDYQLQLGYSVARIDRLGRFDLDLLLHVSPGGVDAANSAVRIRAVTQGRLADARYAYLGLVLDRATRLRAGWSWSLQMIGQYAEQPLPATEQAGLGGQGLVRGYTLDDGAYDRALVLRNELHAPPLPVQASFMTALAPYGFIDAGFASNLASRHTQTAASLGLGLSALLASRLSAELDLARALTTGPSTRDGAWRLESRVSLAF